METKTRTIQEIQADLERLNNLPPTADSIDQQNRLTMRFLLLGELRDLEGVNTATQGTKP